ncbi:MAG: right-handed parallel beta-helix repeat-containing protein [Flavobacteriales bacterium]|nr:right-handed parallel beta-helix repeat-containing protein [Flavobacteriales bacterium]
MCVEPGLGENNWGYFGIRATGAGLVITDNVLEDIGYIGIGADGNALIERNVVRRALLILNDGGGIAIDNADGLIIRNNIVSDISGNIESTAPNFQAYHPICHGIYFGNISIKNTLVKSNTVANCLGSGVHVDHTMVSQGNRIEDNVLFNNTVQLSISTSATTTAPGPQHPTTCPPSMMCTRATCCTASPRTNCACSNCTCTPTTGWTTGPLRTTTISIPTTTAVSACSTPLAGSSAISRSSAGRPNGART